MSQWTIIMRAECIAIKKHGLTLEIVFISVLMIFIEFNALTHYQISCHASGSKIFHKFISQPYIDNTTLSHACIGTIAEKMPAIKAHK